jgi:hypothetical protein
MSYPSFREFLREANLTRTSPVLAKGTRVQVPHRGRMVKAKVIRYDKGDPHGWPFYVVDVGEYESPKVPVDKVRVESGQSIHELIKKPWPPGPTDPDDGGDGDGDAGDGGDGDGDGSGE